MATSNTEGASSQEPPFLIYYSKPSSSEELQHASESGLMERAFTRSEFWTLIQRAASLLKSLGVGAGSRVAHYFSANDPLDLVFRVAATLQGAVPVTVNWQADSVERILYKISTTGAKVVLSDPQTPKSVLEQIKAHEIGRGVAFVEAHQALEQEPEPAQAPETENEAENETVETKLPLTATKIVIFTSGTTGNPKGVQLTYQNYRTNRRAMEQLVGVSPNEVRGREIAGERTRQGR